MAAALAYVACDKYLFCAYVVYDACRGHVYPGNTAEYVLDFSENGQGDVLASSKRDGNDNIHLPSAIKALSAGVEEVMKDHG